MDRATPMKDYKCPECGAANEVELRPQGNATGLYCKKCGRWIKWVGKDEYWTIKHRFEKTENTTPTVELPDELIINGVTYIRKKESK